MISFLLPCILWGWVDPDADKMHEGNRLYKEKKFDKAEKLYEELSKKKGKKRQKAIAHFNRGNALYQQGKFKEATAEFFKASQLNDKDLRQKALNNMGNSYAKSGDIRNALKSYLSAINENPQNKEVRKNIERLLQKPPEKEQKKKQEDSQKQEQQQQKKQQAKQESQKNNDDKRDERQKASADKPVTEAEQKLAEKLIKEASRDKVRRRKPKSRNTPSLPY